MVNEWSKHLLSPKNCPFKVSVELIRVKVNTRPKDGLLMVNNQSKDHVQAQVQSPIKNSAHNHVQAHEEVEIEKVVKAPPGGH